MRLQRFSRTALSAVAALIIAPLSVAQVGELTTLQLDREITATSTSAIGVTGGGELFEFHVLKNRHGHPGFLIPPAELGPEFHNNTGLPGILIPPAEIGPEYRNKEGLPGILIPPAEIGPEYRNKEGLPGILIPPAEIGPQFRQLKTEHLSVGSGFAVIRTRSAEFTIAYASVSMVTDGGSAKHLVRPLAVLDRHSL